MDFEGWGDQEFIWGHIRFEMPARYPSVDVSRQLDRCTRIQERSLGLMLASVQLFLPPILSSLHTLRGA